MDIRRVVWNFTENTAALHDGWVPHEIAADNNKAVDFLTNVAGDGALLEFGIGTGRLAIPIAVRGVPVTGIDYSPAMLKLLDRHCVESDVRIHAIEGDFSTTTLDDRFNVVVCAYNAVFYFNNQEEQLEVLKRAAEHLEVGGSLVAEIQLPSFDLFKGGRAAGPTRISEESSELVMILHDQANQTLVREVVQFRESGIERAVNAFRYVTPSELDLMAKYAGLTCVGRYRDWSKAPFDGADRYIGVYQKITSSAGSASV